jgi:hypothetical protein
MCCPLYLDIYFACEKKYRKQKAMLVYLKYGDGNTAGDDRCKQFEA